MVVKMKARSLPQPSQTHVYFSKVVGHRFVAQTVAVQAEVVVEVIEKGKHETRATEEPSKRISREDC